MPTSATSRWNPSRSVADAPDWPWSESMVTTWSAGQPRAIARCRNAYCRFADSVLVSTCRSVDCRTYRNAVRARWVLVTLPASAMFFEYFHGDNGAGLGALVA